MKRLIPVYWLTMLVLVLLSVSSLANSAEQVVLQLKWKHQFQFAGFYAAQKQGYFAEEGLDVEIREIDQSHSPISTVLNGEAQYGVADSSLVLERLKGEPLVIVAALFQHSPLVLLTLESSNILSPLELKGKRVMYRKNTDDAVLVAMFHELGLKDSEHTQLAQTFKEEALLDGTADAISAYSTNQPYYFQLRDIPINIISPANYGIDFYGDMLFVREDYLLENKEQVLAFRRATLKGWAYAISHQQEIVQWMIDELGVEKEPSHLLYEAERTARLIQSEMVELGYFSVNRLSRIATIYKELGLAPKDGEISGIDYVDYYRESNDGKHWLSVIGVGLLIFAALALVLWVINLRLKAEVSIRTNELENASQDRDDYLGLIDRYVMAATFNEDGHFEKVSAAFCQITGYTQEELLNQHYKFLWAPEMHLQQQLTKLDADSEGETYSGEMLYLSKSGQDVWVDCEVVINRNSNNTLKGFTVVYVDITDKKKIEVLSVTDTLTGLANRRHLDESIYGCLDVANRYGRTFSIVLFDLDHFKQVNDTYGHLIGDQILKIIGSILRQNTRNVDLSGRWGGEEFLLICPETEVNAAATLAELLRTIIVQYEFPGASRQTCSFGVAQWVQGDSSETLLSRADKALYAAKDQGRNRVVIG
ncbi:ABC transporter substrate-binding protein [Oceanicoccus sp. KOV_DT_Chl]|uniref:ABC transporter substrate-binding protein n=1 Tax=Oceanicoccus sp. KOV_DT_Chl TaxID=1904639 RepID=UPI001F3ECDBD|nr:ABC transporter substrate-binding protein [Oceanicoccus sp. KOV_DT_Chl]